ncbi:D-xylose ABC transporter ATP-binding protein [Pokkaliibacter plantistimulans]|uniref:D-xylose ABC transporter ATP-binding protein n=1 Tax=Proteobacteria bacterium 228 TaxID=2083153 RepID=A0A2S5KLV3_9PROT|nr:xylose ABC transporter ATP-binding protein [Pokkaliibacter plantistimulans]PPC75817.1 D-xylose ABC transporter ATP-binding protein [Pokkaliibacter plantistimulans]
MALLEMRRISKTFGQVKALDGIDLQLQTGEVLSLCGENGSGKSTLMKILSGVYPSGDYEGEIWLAGERIRARGLRDMEALGVVMIHQELTLVKQLSIQDNLFLGCEPHQHGVLNEARMYQRACQLLQRVHLDIDPDTLVADLGVGQQQLVEIAKALGKEARLLILDEPTAPLTEREAQLLLGLIGELRQQGVSCIFISHKLSEVKAISDLICVIRDGVHIATREARQLSSDDIVTLMVGREIRQLFPREPHAIGDVVLEVGPVTAWDRQRPGVQRVQNVSFSVREGEIVGIAGLVGSGRTELMECLFASYEGRYQCPLRLRGQALQFRDNRQALAQGIVMVPEDRKRHGIVPILGVGDNITLAALPTLRRHGLLCEASETVAINDGIRRLRVKTAAASLPISQLSGGNQQKAILARCLMLHPRILILDEPTRGIDVGAKYEIYKLIYELARQGIAILMVSSELPEVLGISDRVLVMHNGQLKGDLPNDGLTQEAIMGCALRQEEASHAG